MSWVVPVSYTHLDVYKRQVQYDPARNIDLLSVARAARDPANLPEGVDTGLDTYVWNLLDVITFPNGCHIAEVEVDPDTGAVVLLRYTAVDDFGTLINPMLTIGQVQGGVAQGLSLIHIFRRR